MPKDTHTHYILLLSACCCPCSREAVESPFLSDVPVAAEGSGEVAMHSLTLGELFASRL